MLQHLQIMEVGPLHKCILACCDNRPSATLHAQQASRKQFYPLSGQACMGVRA